MDRIHPELMELGRAYRIYGDLLLEWDQVRDIDWYIENGTMKHKHVGLKLKLHEASLVLAKARAAVQSTALELYLTDQDMRAMWAEENSGLSYEDWLAKLLKENEG